MTVSHYQRVTFFIPPMIYGGVVPLEPAAGRVLGRLRGHHRATELLLDPAPKGRAGAQQHRDVP